MVSGYGSKYDELGCPRLLPAPYPEIHGRQLSPTSPGHERRIAYKPERNKRIKSRGQPSFAYSASFAPPPPKSALYPISFDRFAMPQMSWDYSAAVSETRRQALLHS